MKAIFAYIWQRRWCRILLAGTILCALPMLHPYFRQSLFGPTIQEIPWCVWEDEIRFQVHGKDDSWFGKLMTKIGLKADRQPALGLDSPDLIPIYLRLANDDDVKVRRYSLDRLNGYARDDRFASRVVPTIREHLDDPDPLCRLTAGYGVWSATKERELKTIALALSSDPDTEIRREAIRLLLCIASDEPDLFDTLSALIEDSDLIVRSMAVESMRCFGKRAVPCLRRCLRDTSRDIRLRAIWALPGLGKAGEELIPELLDLRRNDPDQHVRQTVARTLHQINPKEFPRPDSDED